jgi:hypothetical protein
VRCSFAAPVISFMNDCDCDHATVPRHTMEGRLIFKIPFFKISSTSYALTVTLMERVSRDRENLESSVLFHCCIEPTPLRERGTERRRCDPFFRSRRCTAAAVWSAVIRARGFEKQAVRPRSTYPRQRKTNSQRRSLTPGRSRGSSSRSPGGAPRSRLFFTSAAFVVGFAVAVDAVAVPLLAASGGVSTVASPARCRLRRSALVSLQLLPGVT